MNWWVFTIYFAIPMVAISGMLNAHMWADFHDSADAHEILGQSILFGIIFGSLSFLGLLVVFLLTGFAKHGWSLIPKSKPDGGTRS